jgi:hypothetical protein
VRRNICVGEIPSLRKGKLPNPPTKKIRTGSCRTEKEEQSLHVALASIGSLKLLDLLMVGLENECG